MKFWTSCLSFRPHLTCPEAGSQAAALLRRSAQGSVWGSLSPSTGRQAWPAPTLPPRLIRVILGMLAGGEVRVFTIVIHGFSMWWCQRIFKYSCFLKKMCG